MLSNTDGHTRKDGRKEAKVETSKRVYFKEVCQKQKGGIDALLQNFEPVFFFVTVVGFL